MARALLFALALALAGCGGGPDADALRKDVTARLAQALPKGELTLAGFARRGSQSDTKAPPGETRSVVYYDVELRVERAFDFGAWDGPGVAGLVSALGAGPRGIRGIASGGNKAGDIVKVHGTALYKRDGDKWVGIAAAAGFKPAVAPAYATNEAQGAAAIMESINRVLSSAPKDTAPATRAMVEEELSSAYASIRARAERLSSGNAIAAGPEHGQYLRFAQALAAGAALRTVALVTAGGDDNIRLLRSGKVSLALAQADAALDAYEGKGTFAGDGPFPALRAVGSLYPEAVHVLVRDDNPHTRIDELHGQRIAIGVSGAASRATALRVLRAHGIREEDFTPVELPIGQALLALHELRADAVIQVIGVPADSVRDAMARLPLRLLPLADSALAQLAKQRSYFAYSFAPGVYPGQKAEVRTVATAAVLLVGTSLSDAEVETITTFVYERGRDFAARGSAQGAQVSAARARLGLPVPQNIAAQKAVESLLAKLP